MNHVSSWIVASAVGVGVAARIWELGKRSFWFDELYCVVGAAASSSLEQLGRDWIGVDGHPPGFMLALYAWFKVIPANEITGRLPGCMISILAIALLLCAARGLRPALPNRCRLLRCGVVRARYGTHLLRPDRAPVWLSHGPAVSAH